MSKDDITHVDRFGCRFVVLEIAQFSGQQFGKDGELFIAGVLKVQDLGEECVRFHILAERSAKILEDVFFSSSFCSSTAVFQRWLNRSTAALSAASSLPCWPVAVFAPLLPRQASHTRSISAAV